MPYPGYKPFTEPFLCKIIEVGWPSGPPYIFFQFAVFRRFQNVEAYIWNTQGPAAFDAYVIANQNNPAAFCIRTSLITYSPFYTWPYTVVNGNFVHLETPIPNSENPNVMAQFGPTSGVTGVPTLPFLSGFGAGAISTFRAGEFGTTQVQSAPYTPGIRGIYAAGGFNPRFPDDVPDPPSLAAQTAPWGSPACTIDLYHVVGEYGGPGLANGGGGPSIATFNLDFSGMRVSSDGSSYYGAALAVVPKEQGTHQHNPPFTGGPVGLNGNNVVTIWVLAERGSPDA